MRNLKALCGILVIAAVVYIGYLVIPPFVANLDLEELMDDTARGAVLNRMKTEQDMREVIMKHVVENRIPIEPEQLFVQRTSNDVLIWGEYEVKIDLPVFPFKLHFNPRSSSKKRLG